MMNVLITGANGFIGSNLMTLLADMPGINLFAGTRETIDLYSSKSVREYLKRNEITKIIHCAIEGGRRHIADSPDIVYKNMLMFHNLIQCQEEHDTFINIASGAEFDRRTDIFRENERTIHYRVPPDYYGFSKNMIARNVLGYNKGINLRLFGCFYHNETPERFIRSNIERFIKDEPIIIHQDRYMDFIYLEDLVAVIKHLLIFTDKYHLDHTKRDINMSYNDFYTLRQIAYMITQLDWRHNSEIIIEKEGMGLSYCGRPSNLTPNTLVDLKLKGLKKGMQECYERLKMFQRK